MKTIFRMRLATVAILVLVFAAGGAVGASVYSRIAAPVADTSGTTSAGPQDRTNGRRPRTRLVDQVGLTAEQRSAVDSIVERQRTYTGQLWREWRAHLDSVSESTRGEIQNVLTPEQRAFYDSLRAERARRRSEAVRERER